jgi:hypothetical protein
MFVNKKCATISLIKINKCNKMASPLSSHSPIAAESAPLLGTDPAAISSDQISELFKARAASAKTHKSILPLQNFKDYLSPQPQKDRTDTVETVDFIPPGEHHTTSDLYINPAYSGASTDLGGDVLGAALGFGKVATTRADGTLIPSGLVISDTQARIVDLNAAVSAAIGMIEVKEKIDEAQKTKCAWFFFEGSTQVVSLILQFAFGIMSGTLAILSLIPDLKIDLSAISQVALTCSALLCICYAYQAIKSFIYAGQYFHLHTHLAYKNLNDKKAYIQSFLEGPQKEANQAYLEKLASQKFIYKALRGELEALDFEKLENTLILNGFLSIVSGLIQSALAILTLYFDLNSGGMASIAVQGFSIAIDCLIGANVLYDIFLVLCGAKDERIPALKNKGHRYTTTALSLISSAATISLCAVANYATSGVATTATLFLASFVPTGTVSIYRIAKHRMANH